MYINIITQKYINKKVYFTLNFCEVMLLIRCIIIVVMIWLLSDHSELCIYHFTGELDKLSMPSTTRLFQQTQGEFASGSSISSRREVEGEKSAYGQKCGAGDEDKVGRCLW